MKTIKNKKQRFISALLALVFMLSLLPAMSVQTALAAGDNLLANGDFEAGTTAGWTQYGADSFAVVDAPDPADEIVYEGDYSGNVTWATVGQWRGLFYQSPAGAVTPLEDYDFTIAVKAENIHWDFLIKLEWYDASVNQLRLDEVHRAGDGNIPPNAGHAFDWTEYNLSVAAPDDADFVQIHIHSYSPDDASNATLWVDIASPDFENADFELGTNAGWRGIDPAHTVEVVSDPEDEVRSGDYSGKAVRTITETSQNSRWGVFTQVNVEPEAEYDISIDVRMQNVFHITAVMAEWYGAGDVLLKTDHLFTEDVSPPRDIAWATYSETGLTAPENAAFMQLHVTTWNPNMETPGAADPNTAILWVDDAEIVKVSGSGGGTVKPKIVFTASPSSWQFPALDGVYSQELWDLGYPTAAVNYWGSRNQMNQTNILSYGLVETDHPPFHATQVNGSNQPTTQEIINFVNGGGGLFINLGFIGYGGEDAIIHNVNTFLSNFGAELDWREVSDPDNMEIFNAAAIYSYYSTENINQSSPIAGGLGKIWYPGGKDHVHISTYGIKLNDPAWAVDIESEATSVITDIRQGDVNFNLPGHTSGHGTGAQTIMAHREYGQGRIVILAMDPRYGVADGKHFAYGGYILGDRAGAEDNKTLLTNIYDWLGEPSIAQDRVYDRGTRPELSTPQAFRPPADVTDAQLLAWLDGLNRNQYKGLIGVQSSLTVSGGDSVAAMAAAAKAAGYDFIVFAEDYLTPEGEAVAKTASWAQTHDDAFWVPYLNMTKAKYDQLVAECAAVSDGSFLALAGLTLPEGMAQFRKGTRVVYNLTEWPVPSHAMGPGWEHILFNYAWPTVIVTEPKSNPATDEPWNLRFFMGLALETWRGNVMTENAYELYRDLVASDYRLIPVAVSYLKSAAEITAYTGSATYVVAGTLGTANYGNPGIAANMQEFSNSGQSYASAGPVIDFKFASADFRGYYAGIGPNLHVNEKFALDISVSSPSGANITEVIVWRDTDVFARFVPGAATFRETLFLTKDANRTFIVEVTDANGNTAVSNSIRPLSPYHNHTMCVDKQNIIHNLWGPGGSSGDMISYWDTGEDLGKLYVAKKNYDIAPAGEDASWAGLSIFEGMPKARMADGTTGTSSRPRALSHEDAVVVDNFISPSDPYFTGMTRYTTFLPKLWGDNIMLVEGSYTLKQNLAMSGDDVSIPLVRVVGNYDYEPFDNWVYSTGSGHLVGDDMVVPTTIGGGLPVYGQDPVFVMATPPVAISQGGYAGMFQSPIGNLAMFPLDEAGQGHHLSFGHTYHWSNGRGYSHYMSYGLRNPGQTLPAGTEISYRVLVVLDNGLNTDEGHLDAIRAAYRLGAATGSGMQADVRNGAVTGDTFILEVASSGYYAAMNLDKRFMPNDILPVIVTGTNPNWDAVEYDYDTRAFRRLGSLNGDVYASVDITARDRDLFIGNPVIASDERLVITLSKDDNGRMTARVHNPATVAITADITSSPGLSGVLSLNENRVFAPGQTYVFSNIAVVSHNFSNIGGIDVAGSDSLTEMNATATASSNPADAGNVLNGKDHEGWVSSSGGPHTLTLDLGLDYRIHRFVVKHAGAGEASPSGNNTSNFRIEYLPMGLSNIEENWVAAVTVTSNTRSVTTHDLATPIRARYVRLVINDDVARINGFEVHPYYVVLPYGEGGNQEIPPQPVVTSPAQNAELMADTAIIWTVVGGLNYTATLSRTGGVTVPVTNGHMISAADIGIYTLTVTAVNPSNGLSSTTVVNFTVGDVSGLSNVVWVLNGGGLPPVQTTVTYGGTIPSPANPARTGYIFNGWYVDAGFETEAVFPVLAVTTDRTFYAAWLPNPLTVALAELQGLYGTNKDRVSGYYDDGWDAFEEALADALSILDDEDDVYYAAKASRTLPSSNSRWSTSTTIPIEPETEYEFAIDVKAENIHWEYILEVTWFGSAGNTIRTDLLTISGGFMGFGDGGDPGDGDFDWETYNLDYTSPAGAASARVAVLVWNPNQPASNICSVLIRNPVILEPAGDFPNAGFEFGTSGWTTGGTLGIERLISGTDEPAATLEDVRSAIDALELAVAGLVPTSGGDPAAGAKAELAKLTTALTAEIAIELDDPGAQAAAVTALEAAANAAISSGYTAVLDATSYSDGELTGKFTVTSDTVAENTATHAVDVTFTITSSYSPHDPAAGAKAELAKLTGALTAEIDIELDDPGAQAEAVTALEAAANAAISSGYTAVLDATSYSDGELTGKFTVTGDTAPENTATHAADVTFTITTSYTPHDPAAGAKAELAKLTGALTAVIDIALSASGAQAAAVAALEAAANAAISGGYTAVLDATSYSNGALAGRFTVTSDTAPENTATHAADVTFTITTSYTPPGGGGGSGGAPWTPPPPPTLQPQPEEPGDEEPEAEDTPPLSKEETEALPVGEEIAGKAAEAVENLAADYNERIGAEVTQAGSAVAVTVGAGNTIAAFDLPGDADAGEITTMAILNADGTLTAVPTRIDETGNVRVLLRNAGEAVLVPLRVEAGFTDIGRAAAHVQVEILRAASMMIVEGRGGGIFAPADAVTVRDSVTMFLRASGIPVEWATSLATGAELGLIADGLSPTAVMSRIDAAVLIANLLREFGAAPELTTAEIDRLLAAFSDVGGLTADEREALAICVYLGIFQGNGDGTMTPAQPLQRAHIASLTIRFQDILFSL